MPSQYNFVSFLCQTFLHCKGVLGGSKGAATLHILFLKKNVVKLKKYLIL
jgi:hypothetical protein